MSFKAKIDYAGLSAISGLVITSSTENRSTQTVDAQGECGFTIATEVFGERSTPSNDGVIVSDCTLSGIKIGKTNAVSGHNYSIQSFSITTGAGQVPTWSVGCEQVEDGTVGTHKECTLPTITVKGTHCAQNFGVFSISGAGAHLTSSTLNANGVVSLAQKDGVVIASDTTNCTLEVTGSITVSDSSYPIPTLSCSSGWFVTSPITETNPDSNFPTYSFTIRKNLSADDALLG